ncbi:MAG: CRISPR-associated endonuclease Cas2 [Deltaproteobacteria bacterium]|nr:CRISPR-associated endonuclease Cas2 [Deltaproteobacteria bacterium]
MSRQAYIVSYDVCDPKRLRKVFRVLRGYGDHLQLSVFRCELDKRERVEMVERLTGAIHHGEDQVLVIDLGPADGRGKDCFEALGRPYTHPERHAIVV